MSDQGSIDPEARVYPGGYEDDPAYEASCMWWARCLNPANTVMEHPVLGNLPICKRCAEKLAHIA
ncbi:hypothetical protein CCUG60884_00258 [Mycobacteroides salmoniphilum]|uniref:Uncharacterized protein n=1 Tax=Mycobacteroides salmoniphilum TaxID=404941 RepID=A0A4R8SZS5_9MYCO|nr:hypothetical protein CCUG60884_00258 [Mycobacteroides salmoniphilum]